VHLQGKHWQAGAPRLDQGAHATGGRTTWAYQGYTRLVGCCWRWPLTLKMPGEASAEGRGYESRAEQEVRGTVGTGEAEQQGVGSRLLGVLQAWMRERSARRGMEGERPVTTGVPGLNR